MSLKSRLDRLAKLVPPPADTFDLEAFCQEEQAIAEGKPTPALPIDPEAFERWQQEMESYAVDEFSEKPDAIAQRLNKRRFELEQLPKPMPEPDLTVKLLRPESEND